MMTKESMKNICSTCERETRTYICEGCSQRFCFQHLLEHRKNLDDQLDQIGNKHDQFRQDFNDQTTDPKKYRSIEHIDRWEKQSISKIQRIANHYREKLTNYTTRFLYQIEERLNHLAEQIKKTRDENEFNEIDLNDLNKKLKKLRKEFTQLPDITIEQRVTSIIDQISVRVPLQKNMQWNQSGITIANESELSSPITIRFDENNHITYVADPKGRRVTKSKLNAIDDRMIAGTKEFENRIDLMDEPIEMLIDRTMNSLIIADEKNKQMIRCSRYFNSHRQLFLSNAACFGLAMNKNGYLYISDGERNEVQRWKEGETNGTIVAGGNGRGNQLNQFNTPTSLFIDDDYTLYVSDLNNHRVMKWLRNAKVGIIVAGGNGKGNNATQLSSPDGIVVNQFGQIYVADQDNNRIMRWCPGAKEGTIVVGGNGSGQGAHQLSAPTSLFFDEEGNLYVADCGNHRVQKFLIN